VEIVGDTAVVGARWGGNATYPSIGSVYIFKFDGSTWNQIEEIVPDDITNSAWFGHDLELSGNKLAIAAPNDILNGNDSGSAYLYVYDGTSWQQSVKLTALSMASDNQYGQSIALTDTDLLVGVSNDDRATLTNSGSTYIYSLPSVLTDVDGDGISDDIDAFPTDLAASVDSDGDGYPDDWNAGMTEIDSTTGLILDAFPVNPSESVDSDSDGVGDNSDNCLDDPNPVQSDANWDGVGDVCDFVSDTDNDGVVDGQEVKDLSDLSIPDNGALVLSGDYHAGLVSDDTVNPDGYYLTERMLLSFDGTVVGAVESLATNDGSTWGPDSFIYHTSPDNTFAIVDDDMSGVVSTDQNVFVLADTDSVDNILELTVAGKIDNSNSMDEGKLNGDYVLTQIMDDTVSGLPSIATVRYFVTFDGVVGAGTLDFSTLQSSNGSTDSGLDIPYSVTSDGTIDLDEGTGFVSLDGELLMTADTTIDIVTPANDDKIDLMVGVRQGSEMTDADLYGAFVYYEEGHELFTWASRSVYTFDGVGNGTFERTDDSDGQTTAEIPITYSVDPVGNTTIDGIMKGVLSANGEYLVFADTEGDVLIDPDNPGLSFGVGVKLPFYDHCSNGIQDGDETGVDCGGSCTSSCQASDPANLTVPVAGTTGDFQLTWTASPDADGYEIEESTTPGVFTGTPTYVVPTPDTFFDVSGKAPGTYYYQIRTTSAILPPSNWVTGANGCSVVVISDMLVPVDGSTLIGSSQTFTWNDIGAASYQLWVGTSVGSKDLAQIIVGGTTTSITVSGLPVDGSTVYVRLYTQLIDPGPWYYNEYTYTANVRSTITSPVDGSTLTGLSETFTWTDVNAANYQLWVGTSFGAKDLDQIFLTGATTSTPINGLPNNGKPVYVRLYTQFNGSVAWVSNDYLYTAPQIRAAMITPIDGSALQGDIQTLKWNWVGAAQHQIWVGTSPGAKDLGQILVDGSTTQVTMYGMPLGGTIYVRLYTQYNNPGTWFSNDYVYTIDDLAHLNSPVDGSTFDGARQNFSWTNAGGVNYQLWIGTTPGAKDIKQIFTGGGTTSTTAFGLPVDGSTVYVRLWIQFNARWYFEDYTYTAKNLSDITSPVNGSVLSGASQTFDWTDESANGYQLWVGTTPGGKDINQQVFDGAVTSTTVNNLPADGSIVYVSLYTQFLNNWFYREYTYTSNP
jgi:hypothetical protein